MKKMPNFLRFTILASILSQISLAVTNQSSTISHLKNAIIQEESFLYIFFLSFIAGIFISFTPCVYPMIPVTAGILQTQASKSLLHNFLSAFFYVLGLSIVYAFLGLISATTTIFFGKWTTNPFLILVIVMLFFYLAFSLFGFYEIRIPTFSVKSSNSSAQGSIFKSFLLGFFSGTITSPCLTPALAVLLTFVADKGDPVLGFLALFCFALGMGTLLIIIGTFSTMPNVLPGSGLWMLEIKKMLGFVMLAMSIYFANPLLSKNASKILYLIIALIFLGYIVLRIFNSYKKHSSTQNPPPPNPHN